jgi:hypothetical protein
MARITMTIDAEDATDLTMTLARLLSANPQLLARKIDEIAREDAEDAAFEPDAGARQDAEPGERQGGSKFRRNADEIARGLTLEQAKAERASRLAGGPASQSIETATAASSEGAPTGESSVEVDPFAEPATTASPPTSDVSTATTAPSLDDVKKAMSVFLGRDGNDGNKLVAQCMKFKTAEGDVCQRASQLKPADYEAFIAELAA